MGIRILEGGVLTTVQDAGRYGCQSMGFPTSGVMDARSARQANMLLGRKEIGALLETALAGPTIEFTESCLFALTGADMRPELNGRQIPMYRALLGRRKDVLRLGYARSGVYTYIAFAGELDVPEVMGSRATYLKCGIGGCHGGRLAAGDEISIVNGKEELSNMYKRYEKAPAPAADEIWLRAVPGPEDDYFTEEGTDTFFGSVYTVTDAADRMGYRLDGPAVSSESGVDIISNGIAFGSVQIPPDGRPIVMMADRQTMGGYAKIATVISTDLPALAQSRPGTKIHFQPIDITRAQKLLRAEKKAMKRFYRAVN